MKPSCEVGGGGALPRAVPDKSESFADFGSICNCLTLDALRIGGRHNKPTGCSIY
jgi:hypothetical protein